MRQIPHRLLLCGLAAILFMVFGCGPGSPEGKVAATRAQYTVKLENFSAEEPPPPMLEAEAVTEEVEEAAVAVMSEEVAVTAEEAAESEETDVELETVMETGPRPMDVVLHLLVRFGGDKALPGITVEVTQADPFGKEGEPTLHWIDTAGMSKSDVSQVDLRLEGVEFEDGDAFSVYLREVVPAEQHSQYREFAEAAP
ncbi:MAG: hypothetical protein GY719_10650 [bacterium]|nr:hypothetical protein [bacterium]